MQIKVDNRYHFKYLGTVLTRDGYCTREIKMRMVIAKEAFNRKMSLLTSKLTLNSGRNWLGVTFVAYVSETWTVRKLEQKYLMSFEMWCWMRMEKIKWLKKKKLMNKLLNVYERRGHF